MASLRHKAFSVVDCIEPNPLCEVGPFMIVLVGGVLGH